MHNSKNLCRYASLKEVAHNCPLLKCGLCIMTFCLREHNGKGEKNSNFIHGWSSASWWKSTSVVTSHVDNMYSWYVISDYCSLPLWSSSPRSITLFSSWEKHQINLNLEVFYKTPNQYSNFQGDQQLGKMKKQS